MCECGEGGGCDGWGDEGLYDWGMNFLLWSALLCLCFGGGRWVLLLFYPVSGGECWMLGVLRGVGWLFMVFFGS